MQIQYRSATTLACALICSQLASCSGDESDTREADPAGAQVRAAESRDSGLGRDFDARASFTKGTLFWGFEGEVLPGTQRVRGWAAAETGGSGEPAIWAAVESRQSLAGSNVLTVRAQNDGQTYNLFLTREANMADVSLVCGVRADSGEEDQGGGPMWRVVDADNYYVCRINPLEDNFRVYKVVDGVRTQLASADFSSEPGTWYRLRVSTQGDRIRCAVGDKWLLEVQDSTFLKRGNIGLWTKADASTSFDALAVARATGSVDWGTTIK